MNAADLRYTWRAAWFEGGQSALKWALRDLPYLDKVVGMVPRRHVAVQAGGNLGLYPKRLAMKFRTVYTFEPALDLFPIMTRNAPEKNIVRMQAALGYHRALVGMSRKRRDGKPDAHEGITHVDGPGVIPTLRLDDLALPECDLLCLDLEGWELYALQGAERTIARCRPVLCVEVNKSAAFVGIEQEDVRRYVASLGYRFAERLQSDEVWLPEGPCH